MAIHTGDIAPNFIYPDDSGRMFDLPPQTILWGYGAWEQGGNYSVPNLPQFHEQGYWMGWTQWIEKWQKDYRFVNRTDYNATANIFPEVNDPYMFTEYVFSGLKKASDLPAADVQNIGVVTPPIVNPISTSQVDNVPTFTFLNDQIVTIVQRQQKDIYHLESKWKSDASDIEYWQAELDAVSWKEDLGDGVIGTKFTRTNTQRRVIYAAAPNENAGVKTYRQPVWSQSLRWGHSQNITPRMVDMTGPAEYFRPTGFFTGRIVPHVEIRTGAAIYDNLSNSANGQQAVFVQHNISIGQWANDADLGLATVIPTGVDGPPDSVFAYPTTGLNYSPVPFPQLSPDDMSRYTFTEIDYTSGDLVHRGCAFWDGQGGEISCRYYRENSTLFGEGGQPPPVTHKKLCAMRIDGTAAESKTAYKSAGGQCPYFTPQGPRVLVAYEGVARTQEELNKLKRITQNPMTGASGLPGLGGFIANRLVQPIDTSYKGTLGNANSGYQQSRVSVTYEPEIITPGSKQVTYDTPDHQPPNPRSPEDGAIVVAGTGRFPIDEKTQEPFSGGVDTPFFGMMNQVNYRIMQNVSHCYNPSRCDSIITTRSGSLGFVRGRYSDIDFSGHLLKPPGYPGIDGTDTPCHYGSGLCPYNQLDRRAVEYDENYKILIQEILHVFRHSGIDGFSGKGIQEAFIVNGELTFATQDDFENDPGTYDNAMCVAVKEDVGNPPACGHWQPVVGDATKYRIFFYYTRPSWDDDHKLSNVSAHIIQFSDDSQPQYIKNIPVDIADDMTTLYGNTTTIPWLVSIDDQYQSPSGNLIMATNNRPTWGGREPEYKDHTKRGREIRSTWGGYRISSVTVSGNQYGGTRWANAPTTQVGSRGYWTDADGDFLITGTSGLGPTISGNAIDGFTDYVPLSARIKNKPIVVSGAYPISGVPGLYLSDPSNPGLNRTGNYASVGAAYSNDTKALIDWFKEVVRTDTDPISGMPKPITRWYTLLPTIDTDDYGQAVKPATAPPAGEFENLPIERYEYTCDVCGVEVTEQEKNRIFQLPQYILEDGSPDGAVMRCPRDDGGYLYEQAGMSRIVPATSRGYIDVWGPPGTTVKHDAFFWKAPTLVTRLSETQISHKLGSYNPQGGGYTFDTLSTATERYGPIPQNHATEWNPGINRQLILPWASPGETLAEVRTRVTPWFGLGIYATSGAIDLAVVSRVGSGDVRVLPDDESSFVLQLNDVIKYQREVVGGKTRYIGLLVNVGVHSVGTIAIEPIVRADSPKPIANDYPVTEMGIRLYQEDLREWLLNAVDNTYSKWASNVSASKNALSAALDAAGKDPELGKPFSPGAPPGSTIPGAGAGTMDLDERIIAPYSEYESSGLNFATTKEMQRLRNRILPMLSYRLDTDEYLYTAGGDFTTSQQLSNSQRFIQAKREVPQAKWGTVPPQIIAATQTGHDTYVEWDDPNRESAKARAYYPTGSTWWRVNQTIGHIKRNGGSNPLHLDCDPRAVSEEVYDLYLSKGMGDYTGDVVSTVTYFLHGLLPMDKEVVAAYVIFKTDNGPSASALGCVGVYDGFEGRRKPGGGLWEDEAAYRGNDNCYWQHFHPWKTTHENDIGSYANGSVESNWGNPGYAGLDSKIHWTTGGKQDAGALYVASSVNVSIPERQLHSSYDWWYWRDEAIEKAYTPQTTMIGMGFFDKSFGFDFAQPFLQSWNWGEDLVQLKTEYEIWKEMSSEQFGQAADTHHANIMAAADTTESILTFEYYSPSFRNNVAANQQQGIPSWIDYTNYDTSNRFSRHLNIAKLHTDASWANGPQVIVQADPPAGGGFGSDQAGNVERLLNVTKTIKRLYNQRVPRFYKAKLGKAYDELFDWDRSKTDTNITNNDPYDSTESGLAIRLHDGAPNGSEYAPEYWINYRYMKQTFSYNYGMWLNDPWHMPILANDAVVASGEDPMPIDSDTAQHRIAECTDWDKMGLDSDDVNYMGYHPFSLCLSDTETFDDTVGTTIRPEPENYDSKYWRFVSKVPTVQWFAIDLRQSQYERWRRPYRYEAPKVDSTNATCPNVNGCWVAQSHITVGELYTQSIHSPIGGGITPSKSSPRCVVCNTTLTGVAYTQGDGIITTDYDDVDDPNPIINAIEVSIATHDGWKPDVKHPFVVETYNSVSGQWDQLLTVNLVGNQYQYLQWDGTSWNWTATDELPAVMKGWEGDHLGNPKNAPIGIHFIVRAVQKIRMKVIYPAYDVHDETFDCTPTPVESKIYVAGLDLPISHYIGEAITLSGPDELEQTMTVTDVQANDEGFDVYLSDIPDETVTEFSMSVAQYISRCTRFNAYGYPFAPGEITITAPAIAYNTSFGVGNTEFRMPAVPTQINKVVIQAGEEPGIQMHEADDAVTDFNWTVTSVTVGLVTFKKITSGKWWYDNQKNSVLVPSTYLDDGVVKNIWDLNRELYESVDPLLIDTIPSRINISYYTGLGSTVTVPVESAGMGPSYQLDKECVCFIAHNTPDNQEIPSWVQSDSLPDMGQSVNLAANNNQKTNLNWYCYNHDPIIWNRDIGFISGNELSAGAWDDNSIMNLWSGNRGSVMSDIGEGGLIRGTAKGDVTIYGAPGIILSGNVTVYAKAMTTRSYQSDVDVVKTYERTGGYNEGAFVFRLQINELIENARKSISAELPRVVVYLRERDESKEILPSGYEAGDPYAV